MHKNILLLSIVISSLFSLCLVILMGLIAKHAWPDGRVNLGDDNMSRSRGARASLAMELVSSGKQVEVILGDPENHYGALRRQTMRKLQYWDFAFIACYTYLFGAIGWVITLTSGRLNHVLGYAVIAISVVAGLCDSLENIFILRVIHINCMTPEPGPIRAFAVCKWDAFFFVLVLLAGWLYPWAMDGILSQLFVVLSCMGLLIAGVWGLKSIRASNLAQSLVSIEHATNLAVFVVGALFLPRIWFFLMKSSGGSMTPR